MAKRSEPSQGSHINELMLLVDRSRSVGTGGMSSQRVLARALLEALPPAQRFNIILFARTATQVFPIARAATGEALDALTAAADPTSLRTAPTWSRRSAGRPTGRRATGLLRGVGLVCW